MRETKTTNPELIQLITLLKKESREKQAAIWLDIAEYLSKTRSQRITVNLSTINRNTKRADTVIVPGKLLRFRHHKPCSHSSSLLVSLRKPKAKLAAAKAKYVSIPELLEKNPKGANIRIIR